MEDFTPTNHRRRNSRSPRTDRRGENRAADGGHKPDAADRNELMRKTKNARKED